MRGIVARDSGSMKLGEEPLQDIVMSMGMVEPLISLVQVLVNGRVAVASTVSAKLRWTYFVSCWI